MEEFLTPPTSPEFPVKKNNQIKYSTLPIENSLVYCNEKTNLKFGSVFSLSDNKSKKNRKLSQSSTSVSEQSCLSGSEEKKRKFKFGSVLSLTSSSDKSDKSKKNRKISQNSQTSDQSVPSSEEKVTKVLKSPLKLLRKLSFSKKSKKYVISEDTMDGGNSSNNNGKANKKKGGKNKWKKVNPLDENINQTANTSSIPDTKYSEREINVRAPSSSPAISSFIENERNTISSDLKTESVTTFIEKEGEIKEGVIKSNDSPNEINESVSAPASSQEFEVTTDNEEYHDVQSETQVMSEPTETKTVDKNRTEIISDSNTSEIVGGKNNSLNNIPISEGSDKNNSLENTTPVVAKTASDIKKEILSITTPIVTEVGVRKKEKEATSPKVSFGTSENTIDTNNSTSVSAIETSSKSANPTNGGTSSKEVSPYNSKMPDKREFLYKILVIGELGAGKTSIIKRYVHQFFSPHYRATIGVDFALKVLTWDQDTIIRLQLWDIAGQERFGNMTRVYYKEAVGAFIVFDVTRAATFDAVLKWKQDLDSKVQLPDGAPIPCVLLANKCDQPKEGIAANTTKIDEFIKENNFSAWFETSAKDNVNIDDAARTLVQKILENDKVQQNGNSVTSEKVFSLNRNEKSSTSNGKSCAC